MDLDEIEDLIRRCLSTGIAVVLILIAPGGRDEDAAPRNDPAAVTVAPDAGPPADGPYRGPVPADPDPDARDGTPPEESTGTGATPTGEAPGAGATDDAAGGGPRDRPAGTPDTTDPGPTGGPGTPGTSAAEGLGWGTPVQEDDFTSGLAQWELYDGPGHAGQGRRSPSAATVQDGVLTITGDATGTTAGMCWAQGQRYGRWEGRVRAPASDPSYDALLLLWPDAGDVPAGGEVDFMEMQDPTRQSTDFFLHHGADDRQVTGRVEVDATQWHTWAVEWTPEAITAYVDGGQWFRSTDTATFPPGPMHLCVQLDWFPQGSAEVRESSMQVDWVRRYAPPTG